MIMFTIYTMYVLTHKTCYLIQIVDIYLTTISLYLYILYTIYKLE